ncbi:MAG: heavy metal translocating P-type ATPase [Anaerolineales bacterium]
MSNQHYHIGNMDCANCAKEVELGVLKLDGVRAARVDFASGQLHIEGEIPYAQLEARVQALGKTIARPDEMPQAPAPRRGGALGFWDYLVARRETQFALVGGALTLLTALATLAGLPSDPARALYTLGMALTLYPILKSGLNGLRINHHFNINLLMSIAAVGAILIGEYLEGATVIFLFAVGEALEGYTADRARQSISSLMALKPATATRLDGNTEQVIPVEELRPGDVILVKPGENIPMDGEVRTGAGGVNQAPITGESVPVAKAPGDAVFAGTINGEATLTIDVTRHAADNTLNRIIQMVQEAQSTRAPSQRLIDRFAAWYTPLVVSLAALVATVPPLVFGAPFLSTGAETGWLYRALAMLVIACPCALVISTPVTVISAITAAARGGVLIKGGAHLEALAGVRALAFDKTGTLTQGRPHVTDYRALDCSGGATCECCDDLLALASAVERRTAHPLAEAVVGAATARALDTVYEPAEAVEMLAGQGVRGQVSGRTITLGSHRLFDEHYPHSADFCQTVQAIETRGQTTMLLADEDTVRGYIALADTARPTSQQAIAQLNALGLNTVMLTGDNPSVAGAIGAEVGVTDVRAGLLPGDKVSAVQALAADYGPVAMVGDGVNDTPALAAASVGIAMGGAGSPQALETADVALMADDLARLPFTIRLARFARRLILQNVMLSFAVKAVFLVLAFFGMTTLWVAILADMGMSLLVTLNGMRPLRNNLADNPNEG